MRFLKSVSMTTEHTFQHPVALVNNLICGGAVLKVQVLVPVNCWCAMLSLFLNTTSTKCFGLVRSS
jgi:hypothetical protein